MQCRGHRAFDHRRQIRSRRCLIHLLQRSNTSSMPRSGPSCSGMSCGSGATNIASIWRKQLHMCSITRWSSSPTGASLTRPVNYCLVRIMPPAGIEIDPTRRPFVIVDPRAGHGPGIGGFKADSEIGVASKGRSSLLLHRLPAGADAGPDHRGYRPRRGGVPGKSLANCILKPTASRVSSATAKPAGRS